MGKNKRRQLEYRDNFHSTDLLCDSAEELDFLDWCVEAAQLSVIVDFEYQPKSIQLSESIRYTAFDGKKRVLFREHIYSPDFCLKIIPSLHSILAKEFKVPYEAMDQHLFNVYIDIKGQFQRSDGGRSFSINQKWVWQKAGIYVNKIVPKDFFQVCGCPKACFTTRKTRKARTSFKDFKTLAEVFKPH